MLVDMVVSVVCDPNSPSFNVKVPFASPLGHVILIDGFILSVNDYYNGPFTGVSTMFLIQIVLTVH